MEGKPNGRPLEDGFYKGKYCGRKVSGRNYSVMGRGAGIFPRGKGAVSDVLKKEISAEESLKAEIA